MNPIVALLLALAGRGGLGGRTPRIGYNAATDTVGRRRPSRLSQLLAAQRNPITASTELVDPLMPKPSPGFRPLPGSAIVPRTQRATLDAPGRANARPGSVPKAAPPGRIYVGSANGIPMYRDAQTGDRYTGATGQERAFWTPWGHTRTSSPAYANVRGYHLYNEQGLPNF